MKGNSGTNVSVAPVIVIVFALMVGLLLLSGLPLSTQAGPLGDLPGRDTPTPAPQKGGGDGGSGFPPVAWIELSLQGAKPGLWSVVQWQDTAGGWHDVDGWGAAAGSGVLVWGVFPSEFGKGPFRWAIYEGPGGKLSKSSMSFNLPAKSGEVVRVSVSL